MKCSKCNNEIKPEYSFCTECGTELVQACPECGKKYEDGDKFCGYCGNSLDKEKSQDNNFDNKNEPSSPSPLDSSSDPPIKKSTNKAERRSVTVVFADLSGFTSMAEKLDPEEVRAILNDCFEVINKVVDKYDGTIDKYIGDAALALFGVPNTHEDDPERAILSALKMRNQIEKLGKQRGKKLRLKIGINTGLVVCGSLGSENIREYTVIGDSVNLASRLQDMANAGQIFISDKTFKRVEGKFECRALWDQNIKGKEEAVDVYEVLKKKNISEKDDGTENIEADFVGRQAELELLKKYCEQSLSGQGQVVSVVGDAGIGKSRLVYELFSTYLHTKDIFHVKGRALSYGQTSTYMIFREILRTFFDLKNAADEDEIEEKIKETISNFDIERKKTIPAIKSILGLEPSEQTFLELSLEERKKQTFEAVKNVFLEQARLKPFVLFFEDLHWMDRTSYELLTFLIQHIKHLPVFILCVYRPKFKHEWFERSNYSQLTLKELSGEESDKMINSLLGTKDVTSKLGEFIRDKAQGNPFYIEEITGALKNSGFIEENQEGWTLCENVEFSDIPDSIQGIIMSRIDQLGEEEHRVLQLASVVGRIFHKSIVERISNWQDLDEQFENLQNREIIYLRSVYPSKEYIFRHILTQETIYNNLLKTRRKKLHQKIARIIEDLHADEIEEYFELLSFHYRRADIPEKAYSYLLKSADKAEKLYANDVAIDHYKLALKTAKEIDDRVKQAKIHKKLGKLHFRVGKLEDSLSEYQNSLQQFEEAALRDEQGEIYFQLGRIYRRWGELEKAHDCWEEALSISQEYENEDLSIPVRHRLIALYRDWGEIDKAKKLNDELAELSKKREEPQLREYIYTNRGLIKEKVGDFEGAIKHFEDSLALAKKIKNRSGEAYILNVLGRNYYKQSRFKKALECCKRSRKLSEEMGYIEGMAWSYNHLGKIYLRLGQLNRAHELLLEALKSSRLINYQVLEADTLTALASVNRRLGNFDEVLEYQNKGLEITKELGDEALLVDQLYSLATALRDVGRIEEAFKNYKKCLGIARKEVKKELLCQAHLSLGALNLKCSNYQTAQEHLNESLELAYELGDKRGVSFAQNTLSQLWSDVGDWKKAKKLAEKALEIARETGDKDSLPLSFTLLGRAYFRKGNFKKQKEYYSKALDAARAIGIKQFEARSKYERSYLAWQNNNHEKALELCLEAKKMNKEMGEKIEEPRYALRLGNLYFKLERIDDAHSVLEKIRPVVHKYHQKRYIWSVNYFLGKIASGKNDLQEAQNRFEEGLCAQIELDNNLSKEMQDYYWAVPNRLNLLKNYCKICKKNDNEFPPEFIEFKKKLIAQKK